MSQDTQGNNDYVFAQLQEMFPQVEADVVYMILTETQFQINEAIEMLRILSQPSENSITSTSSNNTTNFKLTPDIKTETENKKSTEKFKKKDIQKSNVKQQNKNVKISDAKTGNINNANKMDHANPKNIVKLESIDKLAGTVNQENNAKSNPVKKLSKSQRKRQAKQRRAQNQQKTSNLTQNKQKTTNITETQNKTTKIDESDFSKSATPPSTSDNDDNKDNNLVTEGQSDSPTNDETNPFKAVTKFDLKTQKFNTNCNKKSFEFITVLSYVGVGKWNGLRLIFAGNGNRTPEVQGLNNVKQPVSIFQKKQLLNSKDKLYVKTQTKEITENLPKDITSENIKELQDINKAETNEDMSSEFKLNSSTNERQKIVTASFSTPTVTTILKSSSLNVTDSPISTVLGSSTPVFSKLTTTSNSSVYSPENLSEFGKNSDPPTVQRSVTSADVLGFPTSPPVLLQQFPMSVPPPPLMPMFPPQPFQQVLHHPPPGYAVPPGFAMYPMPHFHSMPMYYEMSPEHRVHIATPQPVVAKEKIMYILRGLPGSGKSYLAHQLKGKDGVILSTDNYFIQQNGSYQFDPTQLGIAHQWNQNWAIKYLQRERSPIIIDNTNITDWEIKPYVLGALNHNYKIEIKEPETCWKYKVSELAKRNSHGVTKYTIENMKLRFEKNVTVENVVKNFGSKVQIQKFLNFQKQNQNSDNDQETIKGNENNFLKSPAQEKSEEISPSSQIKNLLGIEKTNLKSESENETKIEENNVESVKSSSDKNLNANSKSNNSFKPKSANTTPKNQNNVFQKTLKSKTNNFTPKTVNSSEKLRNENATPKKEITKPTKTPNSGKNTAKKDVYKSDVERNLARIKSQLAADKKETAASTQALNQNKDSPKTKKRNRPSKPPVPRLLPSPPGNSKDQRSPNWSSYFTDVISEKPNGKPVESRKKKIQAKSKNSVSTFTSENDFVILLKSNNNLNFKPKGFVVIGKNGDRFKPSPLRVQQGNYDNLVLDKGTSTNDLKETTIETDQDVDTLHLLFPDLKRNHLIDIYKQCGNNVHWSIDVIATSTLYGDNDSLSESPTKDSWSPANKEEFVNGLVVTSTEENLNDLDNNLESDHGEYLDNDENEVECLTLPKEFLETIIKMATGQSRKVDHCEINVSQNLAFQIYSAWKNTKQVSTEKVLHSNILSNGENSGLTELKQIFANTESYQDINESNDSKINQMKEDELLARRLQMEEECRLIEITKPSLNKNRKSQKEGSRKDPHLVGVSTSLPNLSSKSGLPKGQWATGSHKKSQNLLQIINEETAAAKSENRQKHLNQMKYLGSQMKREQLHALHPGVPHTLLDDIFIANGCRFDETLHIVNSMFSDNDDDFYTTVKSLSSSEDNKLLERIKNQSFNKIKKKNLEKSDMDSIEQIDLESEAKWSYEKIRLEAETQRKQMYESYRKATLANHQKKGHLAMYYAQQAQLHKTKLREANKRAASLTFSRMNESRSADELDLHGLHVDEAIDTLKDVTAKKQAQKNGSKHLYVITGRGVNSAAGVPRVKNAVMHWLETKNMRYTLVNDGYLKINLH